MKVLVVILAALALSACGNDGPPSNPPVAFYGSYSFTGKFCGDSGGYDVCLQSLTPPACSGQDLFQTISIDHDGAHAYVGMVYEPITITGSTITLQSGQSFDLRIAPNQQAWAFKFANGCELEFRRN